MPIADKLKKALGEDAEKFSTLLSEIDAEYDSRNNRIKTLETELKDANNESASRRHSIRDEWKPKVEALEDEKRKLEAEIQKISASPEKEKFKKIEETNKNLINSVRQIFSREISNVVSLPQFERVKGKFKSIPFGDDGKIIADKLGEMPDEDVLHNFSQLNEYKEIGLFDGTDSRGNPPPPKGHQPGSVEALKERLAAAKTPAERDKIADEISRSFSPH